jgi:hypothetical protein
MSGLPKYLQLFATPLVRPTHHCHIVEAGIKDSNARI